MKKFAVLEKFSRLIRSLHDSERSAMLTSRSDQIVSETDLSNVYSTEAKNTRTFQTGDLAAKPGLYRRIQELRGY